MDPSEEPVEVVDEEDRVVAVVPRREMRARNLLHRCTYVLVLNPAGQLYVHKRTGTKDVYPGFYDVTAGGVNAAGESYDDCAERELEEELGIAGAPLRFRFRHRYRGPEGQVWGAVYDATWNGPVRHQESEVAWGTFQSMAEVDRMISREPFCPDGLEVFGRWRREVGSAQPTRWIEVPKVGPTRPGAWPISPEGPGSHRRPEAAD